MHTLTTTRVRVALGALVLGAATVLPALPASSQVVPSPVNITGEAECSTAGPVGRYQIGWTVTNLLPQPQGGNSLGGALVNDVMVVSATESGAFTGTVTINPNPIAPQGSGSGSDGPVPGDTNGVVTLTVAWSYFNGESTVTGTSTGTVTLAGDCVIPTTTTGSVSTSTSSTSTTVVINNTTVTPAFTG